MVYEKDLNYDVTEGLLANASNLNDIGAQEANTVQAFNDKMLSCCQKGTGQHNIVHLTASGNCASLKVNSSGLLEATAILSPSAGTDGNEIDFRRRTMLHARCVAATIAFFIATASILAPLLSFGWVVIFPAWVLGEVLFIFYFIYKMRQFNAELSPAPMNDRPAHVYRHFYEGAADMSRYLDIREMLSTWFWGTPVSELTRQNLEDLWAYGFLYTSREQLRLEGRLHLVEKMAEQIEKAWGLELKRDGYKPLPFMTHLWQPVRLMYRPLVFYALVEILMGLRHVLMLSVGFTAHRLKEESLLLLPDEDFGGERPHLRDEVPPGLRARALATALGHSSRQGAAAGSGSSTSSSDKECFAAMEINNFFLNKKWMRRALPGQLYYTYGLPPPESLAASCSPVLERTPTASSYSAAIASPSSASRPPPPLLFLHGVGFGLLPYIGFIVGLASSRVAGRAMVVVEMKHLSMRFVDSVPGEEEVAESVLAILDELRVPKVHVVAHSYGTMIASRIIQLERPRVSTSTLLDPVCFLMFTGKLIYNFVYRSPWNGGNPLTWIVARNMSHAVSVSRRFYWTQLNLWPEDLPERSMVVLAGKDELVPADQVRRMLEVEEDQERGLHLVEEMVEETALSGPEAIPEEDEERQDEEGVEEGRDGVEVAGESRGEIKRHQDAAASAGAAESVEWGPEPAFETESSSSSSRGSESGTLSGYDSEKGMYCRTAGGSVDGDLGPFVEQTNRVIEGGPSDGEKRCSLHNNGNINSQDRLCRNNGKRSQSVSDAKSPMSPSKPGVLTSPHKQYRARVVNFRKMDIDKGLLKAAPAIEKCSQQRVFSTSLGELLPSSPVASTGYVSTGTGKNLPQKLKSAVAWNTNTVSEASSPVMSLQRNHEVKFDEFAEKFSLKGGSLGEAGVSAKGKDGVEMEGSSSAGAKTLRKASTGIRHRRGLSAGSTTVDATGAGGLLVSPIGRDFAGADAAGFIHLNSSPDMVFQPSPDNTLGKICPSRDDCVSPTVGGRHARCISVDSANALASKTTAKGQGCFRPSPSDGGGGSYANVPTASVRRQCCDVLYHPSHAHASFIGDFSWQLYLVKRIDQMVQQANMEDVERSAITASSFLRTAQ